MITKYRAKNWSEGEKLTQSQLSVCAPTEVKRMVRKLSELNCMSVSEYVRELIKRQYGKGNGNALIKIITKENFRK